MKKLLILIFLLLPGFAFADTINNYYCSEVEPSFGAFGDPFISLQLAANPVADYILSTDGTDSTWVDPASSALTSNWVYTTTDSISPSSTVGLIVSASSTITTLSFDNATGSNDLEIGNNTTITNHLEADSTLFVKDSQVGILEEAPTVPLEILTATEFNPSAMRTSDIFLGHTTDDTTIGTNMGSIGFESVSGNVGGAAIYAQHTGAGVSNSGIAIATNNSFPSATNNGTQRWIIDHDGKMGHNTSTPWGWLSTEGQGNSLPAFVVSDTSNNVDFIVDDSGNVGVKTSAPTETLDVTGTFAVSGNATTSGRLIVGTDGVSDLMGVGDLFVGAKATVTDALSIGSSSNCTNLDFSGGDLCIGGDLETLGETYLVDVTIASTTAANLNVTGNATVTGQFEADATFFVKDEKVGIGTTAPGTELDVFDSSSADIRFRTSSVDGRLIANSNGLTLYPTTAHSLRLGSNNVQTQMVIDTAGQVGIGTTTPNFNLAINQQGAVGGEIALLLSSSSITNGETLGRILAGGSETTGDASSADAGGITFLADGGWGSNTDTGMKMNFIVTPDGSATKATAMTILGNGNVGIADTTPDSKLDVVNTSSANDVLQVQDSSGTCEAQPTTTGLTWACSSDARLKVDIRPTTYQSLDYINGIPLHDYTVIKTGEEVKAGVVAQELLENYPELVSVGDDDFYQVSELPNWQLVKAIQELKTEVDELRKEVEQNNNMCTYEISNRK
tara:strand:+ start:1098 stop:3293 length:2196 start_codon:yes stop_codon:yes gene_type:complete